MISEVKDLNELPSELTKLDSVVTAVTLNLHRIHLTYQPNTPILGSHDVGRLGIFGSTVGETYFERPLCGNYWVSSIAKEVTVAHAINVPPP